MKDELNAEKLKALIFALGNQAARAKTSDEHSRLMDEMRGLMQQFDGLKKGAVLSYTL